MSGRPFTESELDVIRQMRACGLTERKIAHTLGRDVGVIGRLCRRHGFAVEKQPEVTNGCRYVFGRGVFRVREQCGRPVYRAGWCAGHAFEMAGGPP